MLRPLKRPASARDGGSASENTLALPASMPKAAASAIHRTLMMQSGSRSGLAQLLMTLRSAGLLNDSVAASSVASARRKLNDSLTTHSRAMTPYGAVRKSLDLGVDGLRDLQYCCPMAVVAHLSEISVIFHALMRSVCIEGEPLRIILYVDECQPGNPLRPEKSRSIHCVYWTFLDLPAWLLHRTGAWFVLAFVRDTLISTLPGGLSQFMCAMLRIFFSEHGHSFDRGVVIQHGDSSLMLRAMFAGFLADDSAHKYIGSFSGASGIL